VVADPLIKSSAAEIASLLSGSGGIGTPLYNATSPDAGGVNDPIPKAYLTVLFFDERFNFIGEGSATDRVDAPGNGSDRVLVIDPVKAPRNGYAFVYLSNESDEHVYFDNLKVQLRHGHIIEENHYYAYGLRIAGISSRKMGDAREGQLNNPYQYQGDYSEFDDETGWNDFALRSYDPQTGRFINADPYDQFASGYVGMGNDPVNGVDPSGGFSVNFGTITTLGRIGVAAGGAAVGFAIDKLSGGNGWAGAAIGGGLALGATFINPFDIGGFTNAVSDVSALSIVSTGIRTVSFGIDVAEEDNQDVRHDSYDDSEDWNLLYKRDLQLYFREQNNERPATENELGDMFMDLFEDYVESKPFLKFETNVRRYGGPKFTGGDRNTVPDFIGDVLVVGKKLTRVKGSDWFELKQKGGGLYLSSDEGQVRGHIDNLKRNSKYAYEKYRPYQSKLWVVTTADVKFSPGISNHARVNNLAYEHVHAEYRIYKGKWEFRFQKTVSR
jgi:RHS repeat-associated protein